MKKVFISACALAMFMAQAHAQETYENTKVVDNDLNGTARYVGMGGAMEALGADVSTISSNPAGIGLYRHSSASVSFGMVSQDETANFQYGNKTNMSFDQAGIVYSRRTGNRSFFNVAFNYHKSKNFDYILSAAGNLSNASQNALSYIKALGSTDASGETTYDISKSGNTYRGNNVYTSQLDDLYYNAFLISGGQIGYNNASGYSFGRANTGYIGEYDFNISGNINERVYLGLTIGVHDVHYKGQSLYTEQILSTNESGQQVSDGTLTVNDERRITGTGYSLSAGVIFRPVENSPFRIGLSVSTPTWYDLTTENRTYLINNTSVTADNGNYTTGEAYDFKTYTPWKFGLSLGHTVGNYLALGASYEYADYSHLDSRINDGSYYDAWGDVYSNSHSDENMDSHTRETLKGVSTLKLGVEYRPMKQLAFRVGYNYVSPMFRTEGYKNGAIDSYGSNYSSATDYTNWKATNRFTVGLGYNVGNFSFDLAYQYSQTNGEFHPFMDSYGDYYQKDASGTVQKYSIDNYADAVKVSNKRNQLLFTMSYTF